MQAAAQTVTVTAQVDPGSDSTVNVGDKISFNITIPNDTSVMNLTGVKAQIASIPYTCAAGSIYTGYSATCYGETIVKAADMTAGTVTLPITVMTDQLPSVEVSEDVVLFSGDIDTGFDVEIVPTVDTGFDGLIDEGDVLRYDVKLTNNTTALNLTGVTQQATAFDQVCTGASIYQTYTAICQGSHVLTADDIATGSVSIDVEADSHQTLPVTASKTISLANGGPSAPQGARPVPECDITAATDNPDVMISPGVNVAQAVQDAGDGAEIHIAAGEYRMSGYIQPRKDQVLICEDGAVFNGAVVLPDAWTLDGVTGLYMLSGAPAEKPSSSDNMQNGYEINSTLNDLFIDDKLLLRVASLAEVNDTDVLAPDGTLLYTGTFYQEGSVLYVAFDPTGMKTEMSDTGWAVWAPYNAFATNVTIENCTFEKYAPPDISAALELKQTDGWILKNVVSQYNHTGGVHTGSNTTILCGEYNHNGQTGLSGTLSEAPGNSYAFANDVVVRGAEVAYNNWAQYNVQWHAGGMKFFDTENLTVVDNKVHNNSGLGIWSDFDVFNSRVYFNDVYKNSSRAIQIEASYQAEVLNNELACNTLRADNSLGWSWFWGAQIMAKNSPEVEISYNNITVRNGQGFGIVDNNFRHLGKYGPQQAINNVVHNNTLTFEDIPVVVGDGSYEYFFQRTGVESDGPTTTFGPGALDCTADSTLSEKFTPGEIADAIAQCQARGGYNAADQATSGNDFYENTYRYASDYPHWRIDGVSYTAADIPAPWEKDSTFELVDDGSLQNLCD